MAVDSVNAVKCLQSGVRNQSGKKRIFSYVPGLRGNPLLHGEEHFFNGNIFELVGSHRRHAAALNRDLLAGNLVVLQTPTPHYYDSGNDTVAQIVVDGGVVRVDDPCWGHYKSSGGVDDGA